MSAHKRLFFALWPEPPLRDALRDIAAALPATRGRRRVPPENLHLTLLFLGATPAASVPALLEAAARVDGQAFDFCLDHGGWWRRSGICWLAPRTTPPALPALAADLARAAGDAGLNVHLGKFSPHVSLMRKVLTRPSVPAFEPLSWRAREFLLIESLTRPEGPRYQELGRWPLRAPASD